jgi:hypothetical protein
MLQTIMVSQGKANVQLTLELRAAQKDKGVRPSEEDKEHENLDARTFHRKGH